MRLPQTQFLRHASGKHGVILEKGDGELLLPSMIQPTLELPEPIANGATPVAPVDYSFFESFDRQNINAQAEHVHDFTALAAGTWALDMVLNVNFGGTANFNANCRLQLIDPLGSARNIFVQPLRSNNTFQYANRRIIITTTDDGWFLRMTTAATVAADSCDFFVGTYYGKMV